MHEYESQESVLAIAEPPTTSRLLQTIAAAWLLSLGFDVFLHGGLLARLYAKPHAFLLGPEAAFRRIPLGYLAFQVLAFTLYWLLHRSGVRGAVAGLRHGIAAGAVVWRAIARGLYSISTVTLTILTGWWVGQTIELGLAGAVFGAAANGVSAQWIWARVAIAVVMCVAGAVVLQSLGLAPPMRVVR